MLLTYTQTLVWSMTTYVAALLTCLSLLDTVIIDVVVVYAAGEGAAIVGLVTVAVSIQQ